ncbi:TylF/MycF family methyltransferase [Catenovulum sp. 2E275]|uniref:TylF/MycF family methyltransferase n=1 Tax=Catenovulum sp. 2E275 TaxID=2980497 RepID=UPI0021D227A6|nr:TylF/MycF family methyltransferase [Catenovulum sp. 2E275]MCU4674605.1 TylF/MycF family methyltransferase [Catenovulum sp. 2E275]
MLEFVEKIFHKVHQLSELNLNESDKLLIHKIREDKLTYLTERKLFSIASTCRQIEAKGLPGQFIEAGCALGGSSILISSVKSCSRTMNIYDVFGMIPAPTQEDTKDVHERYKIISGGQAMGIQGDKYYGYEENLYDIVKNNLERFDIDCEQNNIRLIKGLVQDTLSLQDDVAFAHVDVDWYEPVTTCLERIFPRLVSGGSIILDDYHDWGGCKKATDKYLTKVSGQFHLNSSAGSLKITKK